MTIDPAASQPSTGTQIEAILKTAWETAARKNPMFLAHKKGADFSDLRKTVLVLLESGLSPLEVSECLSNHLLGAQVENLQTRG